MSEWNHNGGSQSHSQRNHNNGGGEGYTRQNRHDNANAYTRQSSGSYNAPQNYNGFNDFVTQFQRANIQNPSNHYAPQIYANSSQPINSEVFFPPSGQAYIDSVALRSNLTPTATEFVPKQATQITNYDENEPSAGTSQEFVRSRVWNSRPTSNQQLDNRRSGYRNDWNDRNDRSDRNDRNDRNDHNDRSDWNDRNDRNDRSDRNDRYDRNDRRDRGNYAQRNGRYDGENWRTNRNQASAPRERATITSSETFGSKDLPGQPVRQNDDAGKFRRRIKIENPKDVKSINAVDLSQRESLREQLNKGCLECLVCCDRVRQIDEIWSCKNCYHVLHLKCIRKWITSSIIESQWRCPACQNGTASERVEYRCLCGRGRPPPWSRDADAHSCRELCGRPRPPRCPHPCAQPCHPGPCPPCTAVLSRKCECGAISRSVMCSSDSPILCQNVCNKLLNCGKHKCKKTCHTEKCEDCTETISQICGCPLAVTRDITCVAGATNVFSCEATCERKLSCRHHNCWLPCHEGECPLCPTHPDLIKTCPCGQTKLTPQQMRRSCLDPIPLCGKVCSKPLPCGSPYHSCQKLCHTGPCPSCPLTTPVLCRCKHSAKDIACAKLEEQQEVKCQKKCNKGMQCGKHICRTVCCPTVGVHQCQRVCGRLLGCGGHRCSFPCHAGTCPTCPNISFTELRCACGETVVPPPVACGVRVECRQECREPRPCGHPAHHSCHQPPTQCPPCLVQTAKQCHGGHEERKTIPCHQEEFSCGMMCGKQLACGKHKCTKTCHKGECESEPCKQPCQEPRSSCGHPCSAPCHYGTKDRKRQRPQREGESADSADWSDEEVTTKSGCSGPIFACKAVVKATCQCGHRTTERPCAENSKEYQRLASGLLANRMQDVQLGLSIDLTDILGCVKSGASLKTLECNDECRLLDRNRRLAIALQIRNPDLSSKLTPRYSDYTKEWIQRDINFCQNVHDKLTDLVQLAKKSKQKTRSYSFPSMNRQKRQFIHEICEHFGCESVSYDEEPNRNVVATADREKSWLPAKSLMEVVGKNGNVRRVPGPILRPTLGLSTSSSGLGAAGSSKTALTPGRSGGGWATLTSNYSGAVARNNDQSKGSTQKKF